MSRPALPGPGLAWCFPRTRGDEPEAGMDEYVSEEFSPHARG